jgi:GDPmannose 4,6-dehydratase
MKHALITGVNGQDGSYLAEFLLKKGYKVFGTIRRSSTPNLQNIEHIKNKITLIYADLTDFGSLISAIKQAKPDELYNLAAQSFVSTSFIQPHQTGEVTGLGVINVLEAIRQINPKIKFYQASSSEMYGKAETTPQNEKTPFHPRSPYGVAKVYGFWATVNYRESYNMFCCNGILFNHESPRRGLEFVTRKISDGVAKIYLGKEKKLVLGNLAAKRDWGYAGDYVKAMWQMLQQKKPDDFVIATGENHSVKEFVEKAFACVGIKNWQDYVVSDKGLFRPAEVDELRGDYSKAKKILGWKPKVSFDELVKMMVKADIERIKNHNNKITQE